MKRFILAALAALGIALSAEAQFSFRTTGEQAFRIFTVRPTPSSAGVPPLSDANHVKFWVPDTGHVGYSAGNIYISQNGGPWTQLSSFVGSGAVASVFGRTGSIAAQLGDYNGTLITFTPTGTIAATTVSGAIAEVASEAVPTTRTVTAGTGLTGGGDLSANRTLSLAFSTSAGLGGVISDETGSGSLVFATSPSLTTPNLGTPSAVTLTNGTGLPVSSGISGLATGIATFLGTATSANLAAAVTNETGSGALVFGTAPTLTTPVISSIVNTGTLTLPTSTDTLVGRATTDTLTNKSIALGSNTVTGTSANLATALSDETGTGAAVFASSPTLTTPTIASFANATHNHTNSAGGGQLTVAAHSDYAAGNIAYNASDYGANNSATWTVDAADKATFAYVRDGNKLTVWFAINFTDITGAPTYLSLTLPNGWVSAFDCRGTFWYQNAGAAGAIGLVTTTGSQIRLYRDMTASTAWTATSSDNTHVQGYAEIYIN